MWYQGCGIGGQNMTDKKKIIYADDLQKSIVDDVTIKGSAFAAIMRHLQDAPAVDAVEVVHASKAESAISETGLMCTACYSDIDSDAVFCKYCGAKMDGERRDGE
jgi:predicted amidophosphoribosyltransferase